MVGKKKKKKVQGKEGYKEGKKKEVSKAEKR